jgi:hypothetical protein
MFASSRESDRGCANLPGERDLSSGVGWLPFLAESPACDAVSTTMRALVLGEVSGRVDEELAPSSIEDRSAFAAIDPVS